MVRDHPGSHIKVKTSNCFLLVLRKTSMAHHKSAEKRNRQSVKRNQYNRANKKLVKDAVKAVRTATDSADAAAKLIIATSILDKVTARGVMHKNTASNRKSSLARAVNRLKAAATA